MEAHGGRIWAESDGQGLGTRFTFTIPAVDEATNGSANGPGPLSADSGWTAKRRARVLVVYGETQILRYVGSALSEAGYTPIVTGSPDEVERLIEAERPHLVLMDLAINYAERRVTVAGRPVQLTATEYKLLFELSVNAGRVMTHHQLLRRGWGPDYPNDSRLLRSFLKKLRRKLGDDADNPTYIFTEPRVGYRMAKSEEVECEVGTAHDDSDSHR